MDPPKIFIDSDGVERGYYVYAHRNVETKQVFYVGKGKENRAWTDDRSAAWIDYVHGIGGKYDVILLHQDLTEDEAINLERVEIEANGGPSSCGGSLVNWIPGEAGHGFGIAGQVSVSGWGTSKEDHPEAYEVNRQCLERRYAARKYRKLTRQEKDNLETLYDHGVQEPYYLIAAQVEELEERAIILRRNRHSCDYEAPYLLRSAYQHNYNAKLLCYKINKRKMKWLDFCIEMDEEILQFQRFISSEERTGNYSEEEILLCKSFSDAQIDWSYCYAAGTFEDAEYASQIHWIKYKFPPNQKHDDDFGTYVALLTSFFGDDEAARAIEIRATLYRNISE